MKKQIVTACALISSVAAIAASVTSDNTFGVLKVAAPDGVEVASKQLLIPVPWESVGDARSVVATNYVLSTGRKAGDQLYWYDASVRSYQSWVIETDNGPWVPAAISKVFGKYSVTENAPSDGATIPRGQAVILELSAGSTSDVFLSGQYNENDVKVQIYGPTEELAAKLYRVSTLIAPSKASDVDLTSVKFYGSNGTTELTDGSRSVLNGDYIRLANGTTYKFNTVVGGWYKDGTGGVPVKTDLTIPAGQGAWYSRANAGSVYIEW